MQWGKDRSEFFTGSSDGVLKQWDIRRGSSDVLTENVLSTGTELMCGELSPDKTSFLIGDASGTIQILARGPPRDSDLFLGKQPDEIDFVYVPTRVRKKDADTASQRHEGMEAAKQLVTSGQIAIDPDFGPGQGPKYDGPFAEWARPSNETQQILRNVPLLPQYATTQRFQPDKFKESSLKRKRDSEGRFKPSTKVTFKDQKLTPPSEAFVKKATTSKRMAATLPDESPDIEDAFDWNFGHNASPDSDEDEDDGYIPPHWMVDANLAEPAPG